VSGGSGERSRTDEAGDDRRGRAPVFAQAHAQTNPLPSWNNGPAKKRGWTVISMKNDWKRIVAFEPQFAMVSTRWTTSL
jgi:hypothetical protein